MKLLSVLVAAVSCSFAAAAAVVDRALPPGHPVIDNSFLTEANYTIRSNIWPTGFQAPTETITLLPSGYSVGPTAVYGPGGTTVSEFPSELISAVAAHETATTPAATRSTSTSAPAATTAASGAFRNAAGASVFAIGVAMTVFSVLV